jgi:hypothetical protein
LIKNIGKKKDLVLTTDEQGQSSALVALTAVVFIAFLLAFTVVLVPGAHAGETQLYRGEGSALFAKKGAALIHEEPLRGVVTRVNNDEQISGLEISVTCPIKAGGKELAGKRGEALARYFKQRLRRPLPIRLISLAQTALSAESIQRARQAMAAMAKQDVPAGQGAAGRGSDELNFWDVVEISGTGGSGLMKEAIFYKIDQKISKLSPRDPHLAMLRQYRKILKTMADLDDRMPWNLNSGDFGPHVDRPAPYWKSADHLRLSLAEYTMMSQRHLPTAILAVNLSREVARLAQAIHREHPMTILPHYYEETGTRYLEAVRVYARYVTDALKAAQFSWDFFTSHPDYRCGKAPCPGGAIGWYDDALRGMGYMKTMHARKEFVQEQIGLNNFVRGHLGLPLIPVEGPWGELYAGRLPIAYHLGIGRPRSGSLTQFRTMEEARNYLKCMQNHWEIGCRLPPLDKLKEPHVVPWQRNPLSKKKNKQKRRHYEDTL